MKNNQFLSYVSNEEIQHMINAYVIIDEVNENEYYFEKHEECISFINEYTKNFKNIIVDITKDELTDTYTRILIRFYKDDTYTVNYYHNDEEITISEYINHVINCYLNIEKFGNAYYELNGIEPETDIKFIDFGNNERNYDNFINKYTNKNFICTFNRKNEYIYSFAMDNKNSFMTVIHSFFNNLYDEDYMTFKEIFDYIKNNVNYVEESTIFIKDRFYFSVIDNPETEYKQIYLIIFTPYHMEIK